MSVFGQLFFDPGHRDARAAAHVIAATLGGRFIDNDTGMGVSVDVDDLAGGGFVSGSVRTDDPIEPVDPSDPLDREIFDDYPLVWSLASQPRDEQFARAAAKAILRRMAGSALDWPLVLAHNNDELVATYDVERGIREFPPGTSPYGTDEYLWR